MKTLIFDFDGTIADSFLIFIGIFEEITKRHDKLEPAEIEKLRGMPVRQILRQLDIRRWQMPRLLVRGRRVMGNRIGEVRPVEGLPAVLRQLNREGYRMIILSTNSAANIEKFLKANKLDDCFSGIIGGVGIFNKGGALKKSIKKRRLSRDDCIYIGDEVRDIEAARKAGVSCISVGWGFNNLAALEEARPEALARKPRHLPGLIKRFE